VPRLFTAFREGRRELGYVEGQNIRLAVKSARGRPDLIQGLAADLVALKPDVIVTIGIAVRAVRRASPTIPIVVAATTDAVAQGFTSSLARPADNITGQSFLNTELSAKRLELLKDTFPRVRRIAMLVYAGSGPSRDVTETRTAAQRLGIAPPTSRCTAGGSRAGFQRRETRTGRRRRCSGVGVVQCAP